MYGDKTAKITCVDNGYVVEWSDTSKRQPDVMSSFPERKSLESGTNIFTSKTALNNWLKGFV